MAYNNKFDYTKDLPVKGTQTKINPRVEQINSDASGASSEPVFKSGVKGGIQAAVWENPVEGETYKRLSVTLQKTYKDKEGQWHKTGSLSTNDIPRAIFVMEQAYAFMISYKEQSDED